MTIHRYINYTQLKEKKKKITNVLPYKKTLKSLINYITQYYNYYS